MRALRLPLLVLLACWLAACATSSTVTRGGGQSIAEAQAERADGPKYRIAVGRIIDKTGDGEKSLVRQMGYVNARRKPEEQIDPSSITAGLRDMLTTELFNSAQFIVLERDTLDAVMVEQEFAQSARVGDASRIPMAQLEGAELIVVGALTAFDAGVQGGAIPIPIPLGKFSNGIGIVNLSFKRGFAAMDLRVIDAATGRIVASTAVEGRNTNYGIGLEGLFTGHTGYIPLPGLIKAFSNTPVEQALQKMVTAAIGEIAKQHPEKPAPAVAAEPVAPPPAAAPAPAAKPAVPSPAPAAKPAATAK